VQSQFREEIASTKLSKHKLTYMPFLIKAFSVALTEYPKLNTLYDASKPFEYTMINDHNITIAVDSPKGLVVPNIKGCQNLSITDIQEEINRLRKEAESGRLGPKDLFDGTITLSNIGIKIKLL
jgi:2-oxoisovalerate dehydrogenase E2 component (dihydrolipoyl transacylase)